LPSNLTERQLLRKSLRDARRSLSTDEQQKASEGLLDRVIKSKILEPSRTCAVYLSNDGEIDPTKLIEYFWQQGLKTTLPVLHPFTAGNLLFLNYSSNSETTQNKYGIAEPLCEVCNVVPVSDLDVIFVPLVGFDKRGNRLGMGGGYYDRTLNGVARNSQTKIIGLAHDCQEVPQLPIQSWDIPLNLIITPSRVLTPVQLSL
jgi:5-formyltetrahydrofolate cyclo-ligase